ncbi:unnamed protein product [Somion occarium]|uniref:Protein kinase domain-containing protein n=1 Tax=Somion occarium TaxID=3059160 RepID=A0ABP1DGJ4_9APHY
MADNQLPTTTDPKQDRTQLRPGEVFWRDHQQWLQERGYMLRPRYRPGWVASWKDKDPMYWNYEDSKWLKADHVIDATRISDGELVVLKRVSHAEHPYEKEISLFFSQEPIASHPHNHCVPIYDVLDLPEDDDYFILVMPLLREYDNPRIKSIGEAVEFFRQLFEGLQFMHHCCVAHRDCMNLNIMMDPKPLFPQMFHPRDDRRTLDFKGTAKYYTRTARPTKYFFIDFGLSRKYHPGDMPPVEPVIFGGDKTVPEFTEPYDPVNPFPTDIYYVGNLIREDFLQTTGLEFMGPLVADMVQDDPSERPNIDEVIRRFEQIRRSLSWWTLRSRIVENDEARGDRVARAVHHFIRTLVHVVRFRNPVPTP